MGSSVKFATFELRGSRAVDLHGKCSIADPAGEPQTDGSVEYENTKT